MSRLRQLYPCPKVLHARSEPALVADLRGGGYEVNEGMVPCLDGVIHVGPEARTIALLGRTSASPWRVGRRWALIGIAPWAKALYPWLNHGRGALLLLQQR
jgi:hypothetical protein